MDLSYKNNKRKFDYDNDNDNDNDDYDDNDVDEDFDNEEHNMMHPLRNNDVYRNIIRFNKKEKIDKTMFTAKEVYAGIMCPTLPKGFRPIPDIEEDNLLLLSDLAETTKLAEIISNLEKM